MQAVGGLVEIVRHLDRENTVRREPLNHPSHDRGMVGKPLEHGIGEEQIGALRGSRCEIGFDEGASGKRLRAASIMSGDRSTR